MADAELTSGTEEKSIIHDDAPVHEDTHGDPELNPSQGHTETSPPKTADVAQSLVAQMRGIPAAPVVTQQNVLTGAAPQGDIHTRGGTGDPKVIHTGFDGAVGAVQRYAADRGKPWNRGAPGGDELGADPAPQEASDPTEEMIQGATDNAVEAMSSNPTADNSGDDKGSETSESEMPQ